MDTSKFHPLALAYSWVITCLLLVDLDVAYTTDHPPPTRDTTLDLPPSCANSLLLMGDFNIDILSEVHLQLFSTEDKLGLKQVVSAPTRTTQSTNTLIDHMYNWFRTQLQFAHPKQTLTPKKVNTPKDLYVQGWWLWFSKHHLALPL